MKRAKFETVVSVNKLRSLQLFMGFGFVYFFLITTQLPLLFKSFSAEKQHPKSFVLNPNVKTSNLLSNLAFVDQKTDNSSFYRSAIGAWRAGAKLWAQLQEQPQKIHFQSRLGNHTTSCPREIAVAGDEFLRRNRIMMLPCGLTPGSHVTVVAKPRAAHSQREPTISGMQDAVMMSQFMLELRKVTVDDGEEPPRILHFNPRIKGDWSGRPVIETNSCYRRQWGTPVRCEGRASLVDVETVDGQVKCEHWLRDDDDSLDASKAIWWLKKLIRPIKRVAVHWPYPFSEDKFFVLTISAGFEGFHMSVDGRHVTSFAYRTGFDLEDATGLHLYGDIDVHSMYAASLPILDPSFARQTYLEISPEWQAPPFPEGPVVLFIGILSAGDHFAERMAVRKSWLQHPLIRSSTVLARFFVALHEREDVNRELKKEAEIFGDIVIVPYLDKYSLVVLKTLAICEYGVMTASAKFIMKCDDDTFVRVDEIVKEAKRVHSDKSFFLGKMNFYHKPLRKGKWAVTYEEWPEDYYPPYSDGPGYIVSSDIARFTITQFEEGKLRLFKMEDVSMGLWVQQFRKTRRVEYLHDSRFCQFGCVDGYFTAHYQSPKQMICLWDKLRNEGKPRCCNLR
ncbi:hypothetical protein Nepgr_017181 [Nepenthes gracilis]|uniref:Galectin domain-containing protein n=1 Tax=Nepenthes gracilis TaxID=150966 RepID=A0AAD3SR26_NEPGR|nr:hypothetical protein Nepgr_017181 [Nepenthes gracilis]